MSEPEKQPANKDVDSGSIVSSEIYDVSLKLENILIEEYKFISTYLFQILQDRTNSLNIYFVLIAAFATGLGVTYQLLGNANQYLPLVVIISLIFVGVVHVFFFGRFVYMEVAYQANTARINAIRGFYVQQFQQKISEIGDLLYPTAKMKSLLGFRPSNNPVCVAFALAASTCFAGAAFIISELGFHVYRGALVLLPLDVRPYLIGLIVLIPFLLMHLYLYRSMQ
jgi:hypothetical protein